MLFVRTFRFVLAGGVGIIIIEDIQNYGKIVFIRSVVENGWLPHIIFSFSFFILIFFYLEKH